MHGSPAGVRHRQSSIGSASTESSERSVAATARLLRRRVVAREQPRRHVQREAGQRLGAGGAQLVAEDRRVGERVAVDLARAGSGRAPALARACAAASWLAASLTWKVPANASRGSTAPSRRRGSRASSMLSLSCAPSGARLGRRLAEQPREHRRRDVGEDVAARGAPAVPADLGARPVGHDLRDLDAAAELRARRLGGVRERRGHRAHAADGDVPVARAVADHVVEEAAVLAQRRVAGRRRTCRSARR